MTRAVKNFRGMLIINAMITIVIAIVGVLLFKFDNLSTKVISVVVGALFINDGLFCLIKYLYDGLNSDVYKNEIVNAVLGIILGIFCVFYVKEIKLLGTIFGIWMLVKTIFNGIYGVRLAKEQEDISPLVLFITVLMLIMGVLSIVNPFSSFIVATKLVSLFIAAFGGLQTLLCLLFRKKSKQVLKIYS